MIEAIEDFKPDIIHLNNFQRQLSASIVKAASDKKVPIVYTAHDMQAICAASAMLYNGKICEECLEKGCKACIKKRCIKGSKLKSILAYEEKKYYKKKKIYEKIDCIISPSKFNNNQLVKGKVNCKEFEVIPNFVLDKGTRTTEDNGYILFFGRLSIEKGITNVIKAINKAKNSTLYIAGDGPERENIENYIKENKLENRIKLLGFQNEKELNEYIRKCKCVVVSSICYENCPYSVIEAMETGKPIIGSKIGGIPELVKDGMNGYIYQFDDVDQLTEKIQLIYSDDKKTAEMGNNSRKLYEENYTDKAYYERLINLYKRIIDKVDKNV